MEITISYKKKKKKKKKKIPKHFSASNNPTRVDML